MIKTFILFKKTYFREPASKKLLKLVGKGNALSHTSNDEKRSKQDTTSYVLSSFSKKKPPKRSSVSTSRSFGNKSQSSICLQTQQKTKCERNAEPNNFSLLPSEWVLWFEQTQVAINKCILLFLNILGKQNLSISGLEFPNYSKNYLNSQQECKTHSLSSFCSKLPGKKISLNRKLDQSLKYNHNHTVTESEFDESLVQFQYHLVGYLYAPLTKFLEEYLTPFSHIPSLQHSFPRDSTKIDTKKPAIHYSGKKYSVISNITEISDSAEKCSEMVQDQEKNQSLTITPSAFGSISDMIATNIHISEPKSSTTSLPQFPNEICCLSRQGYRIDEYSLPTNSWKDEEEAYNAATQKSLLESSKSCFRISFPPSIPPQHMYIFDHLVQWLYFCAVTDCQDGRLLTLLFSAIEIHIEQFLLHYDKGMLPSHKDLIITPSNSLVILLSASYLGLCNENILQALVHQIILPNLTSLNGLELLRLLLVFKNFHLTTDQTCQRVLNYISKHISSCFSSLSKSNYLTLLDIMYAVEVISLSCIRPIELVSFLVSLILDGIQKKKFNDPEFDIPVLQRIVKLCEMINLKQPKLQQVMMNIAESHKGIITEDIAKFDENEKIFFDYVTADLIKLASVS